MRFSRETVYEAEAIILRAEASLGALNDKRATDLLLDNMPGLQGWDDAYALVKQSREPHSTRYT